MLVDGRPEIWFAPLAFAVAMLAGWLLLPLTMKLATRIGAIDQPRDRSLHLRPTPRLGGLGILGGVLAAGLLFLPVESQTHSILAGALVITLVGLLDDILDLPAILKFAGQIVAAAIPVFNGVSVGQFTLPFLGGVRPGQVDLFEIPFVGELNLGRLLTIFGLVAIMNVINFIDGVDGLASGVCVISGVALAVIALSLDRSSAGVLAALVAGGAMGFLLHGFPPASSFMGDSGSNLLGFLLGAVAIQGALKTNAVVALFFPLIVLAVPILDSSFVIAKRIKYRRPIYQADTSHFHHRMAAIGFTQRRTLLWLYGWAGVMAALALALRFVPYSDDRGNFDAGWTAVIIAFALIAFVASVRVVYVLEILKLKRFRWRQLARLRGIPPPEADVEAGVAHELETGSFATVDPETGEFAAIDPDTGEFEAVSPPGTGPG